MSHMKHGGRGEIMLRRLTLIAIFAIVLAVFAQTAAADPVNAKNSQVLIANCGGPNLMVAVNGNGEWTPGHVIGSTAIFIPTAFNVTFSFTPTGGTTESETDTSAKAHQPRNAITCAPSFRAEHVHEPGGDVRHLGNGDRVLHPGALAADFPNCDARCPADNTGIARRI